MTCKEQIRKFEAMEKIVLAAEGTGLSSGFASYTGKTVLFNLPDECDMIVVCRNVGGGHIPVKVLLRHQLYIETLVRILEEHPHTRCFSVLGVRSNEQQDITPFGCNSLSLK
ncbi:hypothetical protein [Blastopirellula marina]|uniref:Uncharacterized protein n=1 Tax=Blastopirellula marina TaxID=124 RepID=A0A2S8GSI6_9BACT|nr:hypothetical protein [Blastopirellula marina]PQO47393.1 hypothetical protein C5Y93_04945 [Blastopirellula marina]